MGNWLTTDFILIGTFCIILILIVLKLISFKGKYKEGEISFESGKPVVKLTKADKERIIIAIYSGISFQKKNTDIKNEILSYQMEEVNYRMSELEYLLVRYFGEKLGYIDIEKYAIDMFIEKSTIELMKDISRRVERNHLSELIKKNDDSSEITNRKESALTHKSNNTMNYLAGYYREDWPYFFYEDINKNKKGLTKDEAADLIINNKKELSELFNRMYLKLAEMSQCYDEKKKKVRTSFDDSIIDTLQVDKSILENIHNKFDV